MPSFYIFLINHSQIPLDDTSLFKPKEPLQLLSAKNSASYFREKTEAGASFVAQ